MEERKEFFEIRSAIQVTNVAYGCDVLWKDLCDAVRGLRLRGAYIDDMMFFVVVMVLNIAYGEGCWKTYLDKYKRKHAHRVEPTETNHLPTVKC